MFIEPSKSVQDHDVRTTFKNDRVFNIFDGKHEILIAMDMDKSFWRSFLLPANQVLDGPVQIFFIIDRQVGLVKLQSLLDEISNRQSIDLVNVIQGTRRQIFVDPSVPGELHSRWKFMMGLNARYDDDFTCIDDLAHFLNNDSTKGNTY